MAIDKKIKYQDQRLTAAEKKNIKPVNQGGGPNYLGKQETVTVPKKWLSDPDHVVAELAYITPREQKILLDANIYGSLKGKPNKGPGGIMSLQGDLGGYDASPGGPNDGGSKGDRNKTRASDIMTGRVNVTSPTGITEGYKGPSPTGKNKFGDFIGKPKSFISNALSPKNIFTGLLGLINPALGFLSKGLANIDLQGLRGYNPDGTPMSQDDYEKARKDRQIQGRINNITDRMLAGKTFSQTNLDSLMGMTDRFGKSFGTNLGNIDNVRGSNLRGVLNSSVPSSIAPMGVNVPTGIGTIDVDLPRNDLMAGLTKMQKKGLDAKKNAVGMGLFSPQDALDSISPFNDPDDPATIEEVKEYYGLA